MKRMMRLASCLLLGGALAGAGITGAAPRHRTMHAAEPSRAQEVVLRHDLSGQALDALATLTLRFNDEYKGRGKVVLQGLAGVADPSILPQMALLDIDDAQEFFHGRPQFKPLYEVMAESGQKLRSKQFLTQVANAVNDPAGRLQALPIGLAVPVLMWNKDAFVKAGLDPNVAPKTWHEVQTLAGKLLDAGYKCPLTSSRFSWVHLENLSFQHGEPITVAERGGTNRVVLNRLVDVKHLALLASWQKSLYFHYFGPGREGDQKFLSGECVMLTGASSLYPIARTTFATGVVPLPYHEDVYGVIPDKLLPDGAALWALAGQKKVDYKVVALFVKFMLRPAVQKEWLHAAGYLPMTSDGLRAARADPETLSVMEPVERLLDRHTKGLREKHRFGLDRLRQIVNEEVATLWSTRKPAKEALDTAMMRVNALTAPVRLSSRR